MEINPFGSVGNTGLHHGRNLFLVGWGERVKEREKGGRRKEKEDRERKERKKKRTKVKES